MQEEIIDLDIGTKISEVESKCLALKKLQNGLLSAIESEKDQEVKMILYGEAKRELDDILSPKKEGEDTSDKKPRLEGRWPPEGQDQTELAPTEDYYKPEVKVTALGGPVLKSMNIRAFQHGSRKLSAAGMKPLTDYWADIQGGLVC